MTPPCGLEQPAFLLIGGLVWARVTYLRLSQQELERHKMQHLAQEHNKSLALEIEPAI